VKDAKTWEKVLVRVLVTVFGLAFAYPVFAIAAFASLLLPTVARLSAISLLVVIVLFALASLWNLFKRKTRLIIFGIVVAMCVAVAVVNTGIVAYRESITVSDPWIAIGLYDPFREDTLAISLDEPASLRISDNLPRLDGATAFYPVYSSFVRAVYDEEAYLRGLENNNMVITCSQTPWAYERLKYGVADIIFAFAPSYEQTLYDIEVQPGEPIPVGGEAVADFKMTPIGREAFVFFVNEKNGVDNISSADLRRIYSGEITNWKQLGGANMEIRAFQRNAGSGSQTALIDFMGGTPIMEPLTEDVHMAMMGIVRTVSDYKNYRNSIGFSFRYYATEMVQNADIKLLSIDGVAPTEENVANGTYPIIFDFYAVTLNSTNPNVEPFIKWIQSDEGQELVRRSGYTPYK